jgi:enamine deaminase RidA (YjgF/YER057c/UK114 family)
VTQLEKMISSIFLFCCFFILLSTSNLGQGFCESCKFTNCFRPSSWFVRNWNQKAQPGTMISNSKKDTIADHESRRYITSGSPFESKVGYSRAVIDEKDGWIFVSGTTGFYNGTIAENVVDQCRQCLLIIERALNEGGGSPQDVVRVNYILPNRADFEPCWPLLKEFFGDNRPAATMIVAELIDPRMKIEIEVTAKKR